MLMLQKISLNPTGHRSHIESSGKLRCYEELDIRPTTEEGADTLNSCNHVKAEAKFRKSSTSRYYLFSFRGRYNVRCTSTKRDLAKSM